MAESKIRKNRLTFEEIGSGTANEGVTINLPLPSGKSLSDYAYFYIAMKPETASNWRNPVLFPKFLYDRPEVSNQRMIEIDWSNPTVTRYFNLGMLNDTTLSVTSHGINTIFVIYGVTD